MVEGVTASCPAGAVCVPVPLNATVRLGLEASDVSATLALKLPEDCGAKMTLKAAVCPGVKVRGVLNPEILNPSPVVVTAEIVVFAAPVLLSVQD